MATRSKQPSKELIKQEILRCGRDPAYFLYNYTEIKHPTKGRIPFRVFDYQKDLLKSFKNFRFNIVLKARQLGASTIMAGYCVWLMNFHRDKEILVVATKEKTAATLVKRAGVIFGSMPPWMQFNKIKLDNKTTLELGNGSILRASATGKNAGRSDSLSLLIIDEAAYVEGLEELWTAAYPTLSTGGSCVALSTPNGAQGWFHKTYVDAEEGLNEFHSMKLPWDVHPERNQDWFEKETKNMTRRQTSQELLCDFLMSGDTVIHPEDMEKIEKTVKDCTRRSGFDRNVHIWKEPKDSGIYLITADASRGDSADYSAFHVIETVGMEQVAEYKGKISPDMFANLLAEYGREYNGAMIVVENNNIGFAVLQPLEEMAYPNLYYSIKSSHEYVDPVLAEQKTNAVPGFATSMKTRPLLIAKLEEYIRNEVLKVYSKRLYNELKTFVWMNGKPQAARNYHDDLIMSMAIACWIRDTVLIQNKRDLEYKKAMMAAISVDSVNLDTTVAGQVGNRLNKQKYIQDKKEEMQWDMYNWIYTG